MDPTYLCGPSFFKYTNMEILLILLDMDRMLPDAVVSPSRYISEMTCTVQQRLEKLKSISRKEKIRRELSLNMLKAIPDIVIFQNYCVGEPLTIPISILNTYEISKPVRVILEATTVFSLTCPSGIVNTKIAPGMAYQVNVSFFPHEQKDYRHYITIASEGETFTIPIICISLRPLLDIPDRIKLPSIPVKTMSERTIIVRNLGATAAVFNVCCSEGYDASPTRACLNAQDYMQFTVRFMAKTVGNHRGRMIITYETGERLTVILEASTYESEVFLECSNVELKHTYITLKTKRFIKLFNKSKHIVKYQWKKFKNEEIDRLESRKYEQGFGNIRNLEAKRYADLVQRGVIEGGDAQEVIYDRIYQDELREYKEGDILLYQDTNWSIYPPTGEVWPDNVANCLITFSPSEARYYETTMYLEVSGREERLVLKVCSTGKGPLIDLNLAELDANDIFLCSKHQYEVSIRNRGFIPGSIAYIPKPLTFGGTITCKPACNYLKPDRYASFVLTFMSNVQGRFCEELEFKIPESNEVQKIVFRGNIVCPLLNFDVTEIDFGKVTLGYPVSIGINLINTTQVPIEYEAQFLFDGENQAWSCSDYAIEEVKPIIDKPKELSFYPEKFTVQPNFTSKGELTLLPNAEGEYIKRLVIVMWGTPKYSIALPIQYKCEIPDVVCETQDIFMRGCFVNYVYTRTITIRSRNEHSGYFQFLPFNVDGPTEIMYESKPSEDFIEAHGSKEIELNIYTTHIGQSTLKVYISIFGGPEKLYLCTIRCNGQGPVITVPKVLYFEEIRTLKTATQTLKITNDSPVPATIAVTHNRKSCCTISHDHVVLQPTENLDISVNAYARAPGHYVDRIVFTTEQGESQMCAVKITAVGSSILCEPELEPDINLGTILTHQTFSLNVKFTNMGRKLHKIIWSRLSRLKSFKDVPNLYEGSIFSIKPNTFDLAPDQSIECILSGCGTNVGPLEEDFYCHAIIDGKTNHAVITSFLVIAEFARPLIELSHEKLHFRIDTGVDKTTSFLIDTLVVKNVSKLAITTVITIEEPFYIVHESGRVNTIEKHLEDGDVLNLKVEFVPKVEQLECVVWNKELVLSYVGHPHKDKIPVKGEENFPNLEISPFNIDFGCLPNFFSGTIQLILKNVSPLPLTFKWEWNTDDIDIQKLDVEPIKWPVSVPEDTLTISTISTPTFKSVTPPQRNTIFEDCEEDGTFLYYRYEINIEPPPTLPLETINPHPTEVAVISTVERPSEHNSELQVVLYQLVKHYSVWSSEMEAIRCLPTINEECEMCCELVDLLPTYGFLGPYEAQMISLEFCPQPNSSVKAVAHCYPSGGKAEILTIQGRSANLSFSVESDIIEFGRQLFCEVCEQTIIIKNTGYAPLDIEAIYDQTPEAQLTDIIPKTSWFNVKLSKCGNDHEVRVRYFPGAAREFNEKFSLQIAYLPPFSLTIHGYGVVQQIFCALPRPSLQDEMINYLSYLAIGTITSDLLRDVKSLSQLEVKWKSDIPYNVRELLKSNEWVIITFNDLYPSITDIQMAIERYMIDIYISNNYDTLYDHTVLKNIPIISNKLVAPPYLIDFGYVVRDTEVHYTASLLNYGPDNANIRVVWAKKTAVRCGLRSKLVNTYLQVGTSTELRISFSPTIKMFPTSDNIVSETIFILVPHGERVPIEVRAYVAVPQVTLNERFINFSEIILGNCLKKDVLLENLGHVPCNWEVKIEMDQKFHGKPVFSCKATSGNLEPKEKILLDLYFEPWKQGKFKGVLTIIVNQNPENVTARLKGVAIKPMLKISEPELNFPSALPYTPNVEATFTIENVSSVPIEFYFADFDEEIDTEEVILNLLMEYYKTNRLYVPYRKAGDGLPAAIMQFYDSLLKILRDKLNNTSPRSDSASLADTEFEKPSRRRSSISSNRKNPSTVSYNKQDPLAGKTNAELLELLKDHLRSTKLTSFTTCELSPVDPVRDSINDALRHMRYRIPTDVNLGILIIFHGAPHTCFIRAATKVGRLLNLPVVNVDNLMFEALIRPSTLAAMKVRQILDESFISVASETDLQNPPDFDEYDFLQKKIDILLSGKKKKTAKKSSGKETKRDKGSATSKKRSKQSSKKSSKESSTKSKGKDAKKKEKESKKGKKDKKTKKTSSVATETSKSTTRAKVDKRPTLLGISEELLYEILVSQLLAFNTGLIIETLDSIFIRKPVMLLNWLLKNAGHLRYIQCVLFSYTYKDYIAQKEEEKQKAEMKAIEDRKNRVEEIMNMDCIAYANITAEDLILFRQEILLPRKLETQRKHEALIRRLKEKEAKATKHKKEKRASLARDGRRLSKLEPPGIKSKKKEKKSKSDSSGKKSTKSKGSSKKSKTSSTKSKSSSKSSKKSRSSKGGKKEKKDKKKAAKVPPEEQELKKLFASSESLIWEILHTLEYWDRKSCTLTKPIPNQPLSRQSAKKSKSSKSSKSSKKSGEKKTTVEEEIPPKVFTPEETERATYRGVPCWLVDSSREIADCPIAERIVAYLQQTPELREAQEEIRNSFIPKLEETTILLSILQKPKKNREKCKSDIFNLNDVVVFPKKPPTLPDADTQSLRSAKRKSSRRSNRNVTSVTSLDKISLRSSRLSTTKSLTRTKDAVNEVTVGLTARTVINPGEKNVYRTTFEPKRVGTYTHIFTIEVVGRYAKYFIKCQGVCEIPTFTWDPSLTFERVIQSKEQSSLFNHCAYLLSENVYDFGTILLPTYKDLTEKIQKTTVNFNFANESSQTCDTELFLTEDRVSKGVFDMDPNIFLVPPGETKSVNVRSKPIQPGNFSALMLVLVKNNPEVHTIDLSSAAMHISTSLEPNSIEFERTTLNCTVKKSAFLNNLSPVKIIWRAFDADDLLTYFKVKPLSGRVCPHRSQRIDFKFTPKVTEDIPKKHLKIMVFDGHQESAMALRTDVITVSAEVINIDIECPRELNFGEVKGRVQHTYKFPILSKIKYNMDMVFTHIDTTRTTKDTKAIRDLFTARPSHISLKHDKVSTVDIVFFPKRFVDFTNVPIFHCIVSDPSTKNVVMDFDVSASATAHSAKYKLCPTEEIYFGHLLIGSVKTEYISLENTGRFDFSYVIIPLKKALEKKRQSKKKKKGKKGQKSKKGGRDKKGRSSTSKSTSKKTKSSEKSSKSKTSKSTKSSKKKGKKGKKDKRSADKKKKPKPTKLSINCFTVVSSTGILEPGETTMIEVTAKPKKVGLLEETILVYISECEPKDRKGIPFNLSTKGVVPTYNFTNFKDIFFEQYVVNTMADFNCPEQLNMNPVYVKEENTLYLNKVCIGTVYEAKIRIQSTNVVTTILTASIDPGGSFSVQPSSVIVPSYGYGYFTILFNPQAIKTYECVLHLYNDNPNINSESDFSVNISGEGYVPEISIIEPQPHPVNNSYNIAFTPLMIGKTEEKNVILENTGLITCEVIAEICFDTFTMLELLCDPDDLVNVALNKQDKEFQMQHTALMKIKPNCQVTLKVAFKPLQEIATQALLKLYIVNNPFEVFIINLKCRSFLEDIIINDLPVVAPENETKSPESVRFSRYELDLGYCVLNTHKTKRFRIKNSSIAYTYRFQFTNYDKLIFSPCVGHLKPYACKEILLTFITTSPVNIVKEIMICSLSRIEYVNPDTEQLSWDDRQNIVIWQEVSEVSLTDKRISSAPTGSRRTSKESYTKLRRPSTDNAASGKGSRGKLRASTHKSISSIKSSGSDVRKNKTDGSITSMKERKIESRPEPLYTTLSDIIAPLEIVLSITADYCTYTCSVSEIILEDTLMFEKRTATFEVTNSSPMPLVLNWCVYMDECFPRRINYDAKAQVERNPQEPEVLANIVKPPKRLVKSANPRPIQLIGNEHFLSGNCTPVESAKSSTIFSEDGSATNRSRDSWHETDYMPFTVDPYSCTLPPLSAKEFKLTFAPIDVFLYVVRLRSKIENLHPKDSGLEILVQAKSLLPLYHFDIMPSDYLRHRQRLCGDLADENTKVVQFDAVGLNLVHTKSFTVINPTGESFSFRWDPAPMKNNDISLFRCNTPEGLVSKGKMAESSFSFVPQRLGKFETFYIFTIEKYDLKTTFLLTAAARNPCVFFSANHVTLKPTLVNVEVTETVDLLNNEDMTLNFTFKKSSLLNSDHTKKIIVEPREGTVLAKSRTAIKLIFNPTKTGEADFRLKCHVERMQKPLTLSVLTNVYDVEPQIIYVQNSSKTALDPKIIHTIELKSLVTHQEDTSKFLIKNPGKIGFYFNWQCGEKYFNEYVNLNFIDAEGYCLSADETESIVKIKPLRALRQKRLKTYLQILYGPKYVINFICTTSEVSYKFSFEEYNFGYCLVQPDKTTYYKCILEFMNMDQQPLMLEHDSQNNDNFTMTFKSKLIPTKDIERIPVYFHPKVSGAHQATFKFMVNSKETEIIFKGIGTPLEIELVDQEDKFINLGAVLAEKQITKTIYVVNKSNAKVHAIFDLYERLPIHTRAKRTLAAEYEREDVVIEKKTKKKKKDKKDKKGRKSSGSSKKSSKKSSAESKKKSKSSTNKTKSTKSTKSEKTKSTKNTKSSKSTKSGKKTGSTKSSKKEKKDKKVKTSAVEEEPKETDKERTDRLIQTSIQITPKKFTTILPNEKASFTITYAPKEKLSTFTKKIFYQIQDVTEPLCLIKASCIAADYYLDRQKIALGNVAMFTTNSVKFTLFNTGDIGGKYKWKFEKSDPAISIHPAEGYISPDTSITFTVKYSPKVVQCFTTARAKCTIEHYNKPLRIEFTGSCVKRPTATSTIKFSCPVRSETTQKVTITNSSSEPWSITPKTAGQYFTTEEAIYVPPFSDFVCEIRFSPMEMATKECPHKAVLSLALGDGHCLTYNLEGVAEKPLVVQTIERDIYCKTEFFEILEVENWLKTPQQFKVITQNVKPQETKQVLYKMTGNSEINVPANGVRQYKWGIFVLNVGKLHFQVLFKNDVTKEYLFYEIKLNVQQGGALAEITLSTCVRTPITHTLKLENPLKVPVTFQVNSNSEELVYEKTVIVEPLTETLFEINYIPIFPGEGDANLEISTKELGVFLYHFHLEAKDVVPEATVTFRCPLGQNVKRKIPIRNISPTNSEFRAKLQDRNIFSCESDTTHLAPDENGFVNVIFEPNSLGNVESILTLTSPTAGHFIYPLVGTCVLPTPQGPILVKPGGTSTFNFKNPFEEATTFQLKMESECFQIKPILETVPARHNMKVIVGMMNVKCESFGDKMIPFTGKLTITYENCNIPNLKWVYYVQSECRKTTA